MFAHFVTQDSFSKGELVPQLPNPLSSRPHYFLQFQHRNLQWGVWKCWSKLQGGGGERVHSEWTPDQDNFSSASCLWGNCCHCYIPFYRGCISKLHPHETGVFLKQSLWQSITQGITCGWFAANAQGSLFELPAFSQDSLRSFMCTLLLPPVPGSSLLTTYCLSLGRSSSPNQIISETFWWREDIEMYSSVDIRSDSQEKTETTSPKSSYVEGYTTAIGKG